METWVIAVLLKPFAALVVFGLLAVLRIYLLRRMKPGWLKSVLLKPIGRSAKQPQPR